MLQIHSIHFFTFINPNCCRLLNLFSKLRLHLVGCNWISSLCADSGETSYKSFIKCNDFKERMKAFTLDLRIDTLHMELLKTHTELREVMKIVLILSHGNAGVEAGVSINEDILSENMSEEALVAHQIALKNVKVEKEMVKYVDKAHSQYLHHLKASKENQTIAEKVEQRKLSYNIKEAKEAKQKCTEQLQKKAAEYDSQIFHLEENLESNIFLAIFQLLILFIFLEKVEVLLRFRFKFYRYFFLFFFYKKI